MKIITAPFHWAIAYYWTSLFTEEHSFCFWDYSHDKAGDRMPMRPYGPNVTVSTEPQSADIAVAHTEEQYFRLLELGIPILYWEHHLPYEMKSPQFKPSVVVYLTPEAKALWGIGDTKIVARHPIDTGRFCGWVGTERRALMVASMPMRWWGEKKGYNLFKTAVGAGVPYKLVGMGNDEWQSCDPEFVTSEERMIEIYRLYRVYGCTSPQIERAALEALATGMPLIMRQHRFNTLVGEFGDTGLVPFCTSDEEFIWHIQRELATDPHGDQGRIKRQRNVIDTYFSPRVVKAAWQEAFERCLAL